jgi:hypothetical protein
LLPGIPREWLEDGKKIEIKNAVSYFGPLSFVVNSSIKRGFIEATIDCSSDRMPENVTLRLPHPMGKKPKNVIGGNFDYNAESVKIEPFRGVAHIRIEY